MKYLILALLVSSSVVAKDQWLDKWESRVAEADNQDAKAQDMVNDWVFDHRAGLRGLDPDTIATGQRIVKWMEDHDIPLPSRAQSVYDQVKTALLDRQIIKIVAPPAPDDTFAGEILPRSTSEIERQRVDDLRHHPRIPEPERSVRAEVVNFGD